MRKPLLFLALMAIAGCGSSSKHPLPGATTQPLIAEGTVLLDQLGRVTTSDHGKTVEFTPEPVAVDPAPAQPPPLILVPNEGVERLKQYLASSNTKGDLRLRVTGKVTQHEGRNYLLLSKWATLPERN